jgi:hypothetical protein
MLDRPGVVSRIRHIQTIHVGYILPGRTNSSSSRLFSPALEGSMTLNHVNDVKYWRDRAAEVRKLSTGVRDIEVQAKMIRLADERQARRSRRSP